MSYTLVLVGGTGQRFGLGLGYLNLLGIAAMPDRVVIVDAEGANVANRVTAQTERLLRFGQPNFQIKRILPYPATGGRAANLAHCVEHAGSQLFPLCYDEEETERKIEEGFYATPKLAALVFRNLVRGKKDLFNDEMKGGAASANALRRVFIVGSVAGGTGAGILRELGESYRKSKNHVVGIVFSRFFDIPSGEPTTADLDRNARLGCDFLLNRDLSSPFHLLAMVGPPHDAPLPPPVGSDTGLPHNFAGLLSALSLVTDGGDDLIARTDTKESKENSDKDARICRAVAFGARGKGVPLRDTDVWFPTRDARGTRGYVSLADARGASEVGRQRLGDWRSFPFPKAYATGSLYVERKLGKRVAQTLRTLSGTGRINRTTADQLWEKLAGSDGAIGEAQRGLESFEAWITNIVESKALQRRQTGSSELTPTRWREALERDDRTEATEQLEALAQAWCITVARGQWKARPRATLEGEGGRWLFPYAQTSSLRPGALDRLETDVAVHEVESKSYPTPLGQAQAFAKRLELHTREATHDAETLWLALSAGWLDVEVVDLAMSPVVFEQLVEQIEQHARFTGILRVRSGYFVPKELAPLAGKVVGATHSSCGLWPGLRDEVRTTLKRLDQVLDPATRATARQILRRWKESLAGKVGAHGAAWWTVVQELTRDAGAPMDWQHIRTHGPILLETGDQQVTPLYLFAHETERATRCQRVLAVLANGRSLEDDEIRFEGRPIARVRRRVARDAEKRFDRDGTLRWGYLDLDCQAFDMSGLPETKDSATEILRAKLATPDDLLKLWSDDGTEPSSPHRPDLLWRRDGSGPPVQPGWIDVKPRPRNSSVVRLHEAHDGAPDVPGIAFHPGRGKWIVWLSDPVTNSGGICELVSDAVVRVKLGERTCMLRFPADSIILRPQQIFSLEGYRFDTPSGHVWPALPVRKDDIDLVLCDDDLKPGELLNDRLRFRFRLFGGIAVTWTLDPASFAGENALHVELWPNLPESSWKRFWLGIEADSAPKSYEYAICGRSPHGYYERQTEFGGANEPTTYPRYVSVRGRPRLLWMGTPGKGAGFIAFSNDGIDRRDPAREATIAVDFGTFRTAVLVAVPSMQNDMPWPASRQRFPGHRLKLVDNEAAATLSRTDKSLFPPTGGDASALSGIGGTIATVFASSVMFPGGPGPDVNSIPFQDFGIPLTLQQKLQEYPGAEPVREHAKAGLKWSDDKRTTEIREGYLKAILLLGAVEAFHRGATILNVRYSFPLAYDAPDALDRAFHRAVAWLRDDVLEPRTGGVEVMLHKPDSESSAGMKAAEAFGEWCVTLDLGGGTLDLGLFHRPTPDAATMPVAWDSVKLGGNLVFASTAEADRATRWKILLNTLDYADERYARNTDKLLQLAMEYAARLVAGALKSHPTPTERATVTAVLLGSGWRWDRCRNAQREKFDAKSFTDRYGKLMERRIEQLIPSAVKQVLVNATLLDQDREKLAVACGLARTTPDELEIRDSVRAPNGLDESGRSWTEMVHREAPLGAPSSLGPSPEFPAELEGLTAFNAAFKRTEVPQTILSRLSKATHTVGKFRSRTALGIAYEYLTAEWFKR